MYAQRALTSELDIGSCRRLVQLSEFKAHTSSDRASPSRASVLTHNSGSTRELRPRPAAFSFEVNCEYSHRHQSEASQAGDSSTTRTSAESSSCSIFLRKSSPGSRPCRSRKISPSGSRSESSLLSLLWRYDTTSNWSVSRGELRPSFIESS